VDSVNRIDDEGAAPVAGTGQETAAGPPGAGAGAETGPAGPPPTDDAAAGEAAAALRERWLRAEADLQNYRRRAARDLEESVRRAEESMMHEVIAAIDDLERALEALPDPGAEAAWADGVRLVARRLREHLARHGVEVVDPVGQPFDPAFHEALLEMPAPAGVPAGHVAQVVLRGYRRGARLLRAARVVVARDPDATE
jgi:molecular chaperone GrpE